MCLHDCMVNFPNKQLNIYPLSKYAMARNICTWYTYDYCSFYLLQLFQYYNNGNYCPDFIGQQGDVYHILVATDHYNIESVLMHIKNRRDWRFHGKYCSIFNTSPCMNYSTERCQLYTSLYRSVINQLSA